MVRLRKAFWKRVRWALGGGLTAVAAFAPIGPLEPWVAPHLGSLLMLVPVGLVVSLACLLGALAEGIQRRDLLAAAFSLALSALIYGSWPLINTEANHLSQWRVFFRRCAADRAAAIVWFQKQQRTETSRPKFAVPEELAQLATGGSIRAIRDNSGVWWLAIPIITEGIDNSRVFLWSETGGPPPVEAYSQIVKSWPMGDGWYFARTT